MSLLPLLISIFALPATALLTWRVRRLALRHGFVDRPNERSSHVAPTPLAGGAAIVAVVTLSEGILMALGKITLVEFAVLAGGGAVVAITGLIDDWRLLSTHIRLSVHFAVASSAIIGLGGLPPILIGNQLVTFGWTGYPLGVLGIVWSLNLFNFMDGIDGIAASEAIFVTTAGALLLGVGNLASGISLSELATAASCGGFLLWNWPPARIFLGDVGSGYLGYSLACLAICAARENPVALFVFVILGAVFVIDATITFVRRIARNERYDVAHRTHGYQRLSRRLRSHRYVTIVALLTNVVVLLPAAAWAASCPPLAAYIAGVVLTLFSVAAWIGGSGRQEKP